MARGAGVVVDGGRGRETITLMVLGKMTRRDESVLKTEDTSRKKLKPGVCDKREYRNNVMSNAAVVRTTGLACGERDGKEELGN